ncbi:MAG: FHA domain-containing protein [Phycisphaeraceae bacterium]|nr:FHA domain-containing protein [Phycisphaeraceae bacterium]
MEVALVMIKADGTRRDFALSKDRTVIGRTNSCDLRIPLSSVSRKHCELIMGDGGVSVKDLGSSNGTYHNGKRVQETKLGAGDVLVVGPVHFTVVIDGKPAEVKAPKMGASGEKKSKRPARPEKVGKVEDPSAASDILLAALQDSGATTPMDDSAGSGLASLTAAEDSGDLPMVIDLEEDEEKK